MVTACKHPVTADNRMIWGWGFVGDLRAIPSCSFSLANTSSVPGRMASVTVRVTGPVGWDSQWVPPSANHSRASTGRTAPRRHSALQTPTALPTLPTSTGACRYRKRDQTKKQMHRIGRIISEEELEDKLAVIATTPGGLGNQCTSNGGGWKEEDSSLRSNLSTGTRNK